MDKFRLLRMLCMIIAVCAAMAIASSAQNFTKLVSFNGTDGANPYAGVIQATDGNFYGTTYAGGAGNCSGGCGTVFKITAKGTLTTLYSFCSQTN